MNEEHRGLLRDNWYLLAIAAVCLVVAVVWWMRGPATEAATDDALVAGSPAAANAAIAPGIAPRLTPQDEALATIAGHQAKVDAEPDSPDRPGYLYAMGNLYRQKLQNYEEAARCYSLLVFDHPDYPGVNQVYTQLAMCYERLGDLERSMEIYERMLEVFARDTKEYEYAYHRLSPTGEIPPPPIRPADEEEAEPEAEAAESPA